MENSCLKELYNNDVLLYGDGKINKVLKHGIRPTDSVDGSLIAKGKYASVYNYNDDEVLKVYDICDLITRDIIIALFEQHKDFDYAASGEKIREIVCSRFTMDALVISSDCKQYERVIIDKISEYDSDLKIGSIIEKRFIKKNLLDRQVCKKIGLYENTIPKITQWGLLRNIKNRIIGYYIITKKYNTKITDISEITDISGDNNYNDSDKVRAFFSLVQLLSALESKKCTVLDLKPENIRFADCNAVLIDNDSDTLSYLSGSYDYDNDDLRPLYELYDHDTSNNTLNRVVEIIKKWSKPANVSLFYKTFNTLDFISTTEPGSRMPLVKLYNSHKHLLSIGGFLEIIKQIVFKSSLFGIITTYINKLKGFYENKEVNIGETPTYTNIFKCYEFGNVTSMFMPLITYHNDGTRGNKKNKCFFISVCDFLTLFYTKTEKEDTKRKKDEKDDRKRKKDGKTGRTAITIDTIMKNANFNDEGKDKDREIDTYTDIDIIKKICDDYNVIIFFHDLKIFTMRDNDYYLYENRMINLLSADYHMFRPNEITNTTQHIHIAHYDTHYVLLLQYETYKINQPIKLKDYNSDRRKIYKYYDTSSIVHHLCIRSICSVAKSNIMNLAEMFRQNEREQTPNTYLGIILIFFKTIIIDASKSDELVTDVFISLNAKQIVAIMNILWRLCYATTITNDNGQAGRMADMLNKSTITSYNGLHKEQLKMLVNMLTEQNRKHAHSTSSTSILSTLNKFTNVYTTIEHQLRIKNEEIKKNPLDKSQASNISRELGIPEQRADQKLSK